MLILDATEGSWRAYIVNSLLLAPSQDSNIRYKVVYSGKQPSSSPLPRELSKHLRVPVVYNAKQIGPHPRDFASMSTRSQSNGVMQFAAGNRGIVMSNQLPIGHFSLPEEIA